MLESFPLAELSRPLPWQEGPWARLMQAMDGGRLGHAMLLAGSPGTGRNKFALALARRLLCQRPEPEGNCGSCKACELTRRGGHSDLRLLSPEAAGKAIGIDAVRDLLRFAGTTSALGARKVILLSPLEAMTTSAFNAFLKGLEEPTADTYYILVYALGHRIPATIRSRCQQIDLAAPARDAAMQWLQNALAESDEAGGTADASATVAASLLDLAGGCPLDALALSNHEDREALEQLRTAVAELRRGSGSAAALEAAARVPPLSLLELLARDLQTAVRDSVSAGDRNAARPKLEGLEQLADLRAAQLSGSNPNADLLRFSAVEIFADACDAQTVGATLGANLNHT